LVERSEIEAAATPRRRQRRQTGKSVVKATLKRQTASKGTATSEEPITKPPLGSMPQFHKTRYEITLVPRNSRFKSVKVEGFCSRVVLAAALEHIEYDDDDDSTFCIPTEYEGKVDASIAPFNDFKLCAKQEVFEVGVDFLDAIYCKFIDMFVKEMYSDSSIKLPEPDQIRIVASLQITPLHLLNALFKILQPWVANDTDEVGCGQDTAGVIGQVMQYKGNPTCLTSSLNTLYVDMVNTYLPTKKINELPVLKVSSSKQT
jgi:hypothetical protein